MQYRKLGRWGLKVSEIAVRSQMANVRDANAIEEAKKIIEAAYEKGVNFFDCADAYSEGAAEEFLGDVLNQFPRSSYVISSKVFFPADGGPNDLGLSRKHIIEQIDKSLKNLKVDYLDMYFCHRFDKETPIEETLQTLSDLVDKGKVLYYGVSEWSPVQLMEAIGVIKDMNLRPLSAIQPQYHILDRYIEDETMGICERNGIGIIPFSPLSQELLNGRYRRNILISKNSRIIRQADRRINALLTEDNLNKIGKLIPIAKKLDTNLSVLMHAWTLRKPHISSVLTEIADISQLENSVRASGFIIPPEILEEMEAVLQYTPFYRKIG